MLSEKIRVLRKRAQLSQERLAEKLGVSRQAVTKWETDAGVPDMDNIRALSTLFGVTIDELLENQPLLTMRDHLYDSVTEYDIDGEKSFDITFSGAREVTLVGYEGEKLQVRLFSDQVADLPRVYKVKIDDIKKRIDVEMNRSHDLSETMAKEAVCILVRFPQRYVKQVELAGNMESLILRDITAEEVEFSGKVSRVSLNDVAGHVELNSNEDMAIRCGSLTGRLDINQIAATSRLLLPASTCFAAVTRGIANNILYERDPAPGGETAESSALIVELNGMKSELVIGPLASMEC